MWLHRCRLFHNGMGTISVLELCGRAVAISPFIISYTCRTLLRTLMASRLLQSACFQTFAFEGCLGLVSFAIEDILYSSMLINL
jgi:hypothetical protein